MSPEPAPADCAACETSPQSQAPAIFDGASADGSKAIFTTTQPLLGGDASANIYEYDFDNPQGQRLVRVSAGSWGAAGAQVQGIVQISRDGSHVYFVANGGLEGVTNSESQAPTENRNNLYVFERDARFPSGRVSFIATLSPLDGQEWAGSGQFRGPCRTRLGCAAATTPDGDFLAFASFADLTPDDTSSARQIFRYDAQTAELARVSIGQDGYNDNGNTDTFDATIPMTNGRLAMSEDGTYVAFESADGLTPGALNGDLSEYEVEVGGVRHRHTYYARNVYEYHDGSVYLISDGQDASAKGPASSVRLDGISASGADIFFETADRLAAADLDTQDDVYDARVGGGFPAPTSLLPACSGDACQGQLSAAPVLLSPGSEFQAGGNPPLAAPVPQVKPKAKTPTRASSLAKALAACRKDKGKRKRSACEARSRKRDRAQRKQSAKTAKGRR